jgi:predicted RNA binding protein YcfA (HicA-like mRNA interferase family)
MGLPLISGHVCIAALGKLGYQHVRTKGSHARLECPGHTPLTVPLHSEIDRGTLRAIIKAAGLTADEFEALL